MAESETQQYYCEKCGCYPPSSEVGSPMMMEFTSLKVHLKAGCMSLLSRKEKGEKNVN